MTSKLDMSLDAISKQNYKANKRKKKNTQKKSQKKSQKKGGKQGGRRGRGRGRGYGRASKKKRNNQRKAPYVQKKATKSKGNAVSTVAVTNLDFRVTESDVREIFQNIGKVKSVVIHYNAQGKSRGTAMVKFGSKAAANKAVNEYHQAEVDGRPMYVRAVAIVSNASQGRGRTKSPRRKSKGGKRPEKSPGRKGKRGGKRGGKGKRGKGKQKKSKPVSAEQLDKEMEDYHNMTTTVGGTVDLASAGQPVLAE